MTRALYLGVILVSMAGVALLDRRLRTGVVSQRLGPAVAMTVPVFLTFDILGAARGWFASNPALNLLIVPPGISVEEPLLLAFLTLTSIALWRGIGRILA